MESSDYDGEEEEAGLVNTDSLNGVDRKCCRLTKQEILYTLTTVAMSMGMNFCIDIPTSLQDYMTEYYQLNEYQFSLFVTFYSLPSVILSPLGGFLIDSLMGIRVSTALYTVIASVGIATFAVGGVINTFWLMVLGRFIFGLGNEMAGNVCMSYCTYTYYKESVVNFMFSMADNMSYVGTVAAFQIAPALFSYLKQNHTPLKALDNTIIIVSSAYVLTATTAILMTFIRPKTESSEAMTEGTVESCPVNQVSLRDLSKFPLIFWLLCLSYCFILNAVINFDTFSQGMFTSELFGMSVAEVSNAVTVMNLVKILVSIPLSLLVDRVGRNLYFFLSSLILFSFSYFLLILRFNPYFIMSLLGVAYSLMGSSVWAMFGYPVPKRLSGSCYGLVASFIGLSQTLSPSVVGKLIDHYGYTAAIYFYLANSAVALVVIILTWILDIRTGSILIMSPQERTVYEQSMVRTESVEYLVDPAVEASVVRR